ncbi:Disheveled-associated activator of morphogenesis 1 [Seminavis robusta]|uniref:Disheveled-associated activator of morphogenesis 1 n=1 Tax=Seminavis robusta TaxID=568900 RepID=A0A9N8HT32_9STRA|nr:Disheveled-associated activator of morphogenesis 1 [Seminavis robusta]|eukprot:Sro1229_g254470.1 Disheveled-associated activator of morphogenesis 1 (2365) ;mRNA; f:10641-18298
MRSLFGASPHRVRHNNSRDSQEGRKNSGGYGESEQAKRRSFAFMKYSPDRRSSASMRASREHARQIAMQLSMNEPEAAPPSRKSKSSKKNKMTASTFQPSFPEPSAFDDFNPFGHDQQLGSSNSFSNGSAAMGSSKSLAPPPQEDFFAQAPKPNPNFQRKASNGSSHRSSGSGGFPVRDNSFDTESVASSVAYDMDFLPIQASQRDQRKSSRGRPPRSKAPSTTGSEISFGSTASSSIQWSAQSQQQLTIQQHQPAPKSMSTFPSNSSMQANFAQQTSPHHVASSSAPMMMPSPPGSAGGAAARRRMRSQLRHGSSGASLQGSDTASCEGTPPPSPGSTRRTIFSSNGSVGSNNGMGNSSTSNRNRVASYAMSSSQNWQASPSPSFRGNASVCSSVADSDIDLFDNGGGGFTFDAFGLDPSEIDREVQEAVQALEGSKRGIFGGYTPSANPALSEAGTVNTSTINNKPQDASGDDFAPQAWDSPPGSRRSTPTPKEDDDGFENGFRVSKPSPLPLISVHRESPVSSERSSSLSSITDHNTDGAPRRNVFKEKAGFTSSSNDAPRRPRPSPSQAPKKQWVPPPGAIKIYWKGRLTHMPDSFEGDPNSQTQQKPALKEQPQPPNGANRVPRSDSAAATGGKKWQSAAAKYAAPPSQRGKPQPAANYSRESSFRKEQEEKKDDDTSEERDNHTDTTDATTTAETDPSPLQPLQAPSSQQQPIKPQKLSPAQQAGLKLDSLEKLVAELQDEEEDALRGKVQSPQEQRRKELDDLRNGTAPSGLKSQTFLHHVNQDAAKLKPQQERVKECNGQRSSFASLRERLKAAPMEVEPPNKGLHSNDSQHQPAGFNSQISPQSAASRSEVGVSSFTRQKMKIASMSSSASKSEASYPKSPRFSNSQHPQVNAVLNRVRGMDTMGTSKPGTSPTATTSTPAFMAVKLRKTSPPAAIQPSKSASSDHHDQHSPSATSRPRALSYRERREMELQQQQQQDCSSVSPRSPSMAQKLAQQQAHHQYQRQEEADERSQGARGGYQVSVLPPREEKPASPKKLTYRERRELELAKEREAKEQQEQSQKSQEPPKRDVADLIRRRIAANKGKNVLSPTNDSQMSSSVIGRDRLRPTRPAAGEESSSTEADRESIYAPTDEVGASFDYRTTQRLAQASLDSLEKQNRISQNRMPGTLRENSGSFEEQNSLPASPRHSMPSRHSAETSPRRPQAEPPMQHADGSHHLGPGYEGGVASLHSQLKQLRDDEAEQEDEQQPPTYSSNFEQEESLPVPPSRPASSEGGLSALHAQLKDLQIQEPQTDMEEEHQQEAPSDTKQASNRLQAFVEGKPTMEKLEVNTAYSQTSEPLSSPSRTPKATYAMLNAFLHGRETVSEQADPAHNEHVDEEEEPRPVGSPKKSTAPSSSSGGISDGRPALKDDPKYARYFTMLKIGMPMDVVKHAMVRDNLDPCVMDGNHNKPACTGIPLKDDPKYIKYFKMLKIGMPMEAVKHAMERDGLDSTVMDQDHNMPVDSSQGKKDDAPKEKDSHRRARLHWKPLQAIRRNSLWAKIDEDPEMTNLEIDEAEFAELFQLEIQPEGQQQDKKGKRLRSPRKGAAVRVIDPKRANNGGIILARLKMSHDDMADVVDRIDENCMTAEQIEHIIEYLPSREERKALEAYMLEGGQDAAEKFDGLCECEKFMVSMMTVKHAKRKVRALLFKLQFESCLEALYQETNTVETSCDELSNSVRLRQLLGIVLTFGNRLNTAGKGKKTKAGAFSLDSLLKLNQAKAFDKKTTFLQYIVLIVQRNNELLLRFKDDLPTVFKADKVFWDQCVSDLEEVENQLENVRRISLYQARQASKFRRKKKKHHDEDEDEESISDMSLSLEEEVEALRATPIGLFTLSAIKKVSFLRDRVEGTKVKFNKLLEYFGEESGDKNLQPHELFNIVVKFCKDWHRAQEQVFESEKKKKREERKRHSKNGQTPNNNKTNPPPQKRPNTGMLRASAMHDRYMSTAPAAPKPSKEPEQASEQRLEQRPAPAIEQIPEPVSVHDHHSQPTHHTDTAPVHQHEHHSQQTQTHHIAPVHQHSQPQPTASPPRQSAPPASQPQSSAPPVTTDYQYRSPRRESAPAVSPMQASRPAVPEHQTTDHQHRSPRRESAPAVSPRHASRPAVQEQQRDTSHQTRPQHESYAAPASSAEQRADEDYRVQEQLPSITSHSIDLEDVIPRGMQDRGQLEQVSYDMPPQQDQQLQQSNSSDVSAAHMRRRARQKLNAVRHQRKASSPADDSARRDPPSQQHYTSSRADPPSQQEYTASRGGHQTMQRQTSAPVVGSDPVTERSEARRASATTTSASSMNHARNKARARQRLMERKQRALGRSSSQEYHI